MDPTAPLPTSRPSAPPVDRPTGVGSQPVDLVDLALDVLADLVVEDRTDWNEGQLTDRLIGLAAVVERARAATAILIGRFDAAQSWAGEGATSAAAWLTARCGADGASWHRLVEAGRATVTGERAGEALARRRITVDHAEQLGRAARSGRDGLYRRDEVALVEAAEALGADDFRRLVTRWIALAEDALHRGEPDRHHARRNVHVHTNADGTVDLRGRLDAPTGTALLAALDALDPPEPSDGPGTARSTPARRADAMADLAEIGLRSVTDPVAVHGPARQADVIVTADALAGQRARDLRRLRTDVGGVPVARSTLDRLLCDTRVGRVVLDAEGNVLELGRRRRTFSAAQHRALAARDGGCAFPGCHRPAGLCQAHHLEPFDAGGTTDIDNAVLLCSHHHPYLHELGWSLTREGEAWVAHPPDDPAQARPTRAQPPTGSSPSR